MTPFEPAAGLATGPIGIDVRLGNSNNAGWRSLARYWFWLIGAPSIVVLMVVSQVA